ncbi:hypothetical protein [Kitasatospora sp. NPDC096204]|uniref:hypothetical protein n=1 Tax=Kitasatospora sp. NPDC096204 TaxID=3364094 RepID=UPI003812730B
MFRAALLLSAGAAAVLLPLVCAPAAVADGTPVAAGASVMAGAPGTADGGAPSEVIGWDAPPNVIGWDGPSSVIGWD